jgi:thiol-disulfide isomerase/thioredoxin
MEDYSIIYIGAKWCATCKTIKPAIELLAECYDLDIDVLDFDELEHTQQETVTKVPTVRVMLQDKVLAEWNTNQVNSLKEWLEHNIKES